jgi:preprotein translocase subunit SecG
MLLYYAIATLHVIVCVILVLVVLLQSGKGADLAVAFGGGATQTAFGSRGPASFLSKMTTIAAVIFMLTSIGLSMISTRTESRSILETTGKQSAVPVNKAPASTAVPVATPTPEQINQRIEELQKKNQAAPATVPSPAPVTDPSKKPAK